MCLAPQIVCLFVCIVCLSMCLFAPACLPAFPAAWVPVLSCIPVCPFACLSCLPACLPDCRTACLPSRLSNCLSACRTACLSVCLFCLASLSVCVSCQLLHWLIGWLDFVLFVCTSKTTKDAGCLRRSPFHPRLRSVRSIYKKVCNLMWSKNINEIVSTHGYSLNQIIVWRYPSMTKVTTLTGHTTR